MALAYLWCTPLSGNRQASAAIQDGSGLMHKISVPWCWFLLVGGNRVMRPFVLCAVLGYLKGAHQFTCKQDEEYSQTAANHMHQTRL